MSFFWRLPPDLQRHFVVTYLSPADAAIFRCSSKHAYSLVPRKYWYRARKQLYENASSHGHLALLKWLNEAQKITIPFRIIESQHCDVAASGGHRDVIEWLISKNSAKLSATTLMNCASGGHVELFDWLVEVHKCKPDVLAYASAARSGAKSLLLRGPHSVASASTYARYAILGSQFELLKWLRTEWNAEFNCYCLTAAIATNRFDIYDYVLKNNCLINAVVFRELASAGRVDLMDALQPQSSIPYHTDEWVCAYAALKGQLNALKILREERNCKWNVMTMRLAAGRGHIACLQYALEAGCPVDEGVCANAARHGHLEALQYLRSKSVPWDWETTEAAASQGHLDVLVYAHKNGCSVTQVTCTAAARGGYIEILEWLRNNDLPYVCHAAAVHAASAARMAALEWLYKSTAAR